MSSQDTIYDPLMNKDFLIDYIKQINQEIALFTSIYYEIQFDNNKTEMRRVTFENIKIITEQKKTLLTKLRNEFNYDFKN